MNHALLSPDTKPLRLFRDLRVEPEEAKSILRHQKDDRYGWNFSLNAYRGCSHGCRYCYVRGYPAPTSVSGSTFEPGGDLSPSPSSGKARLHDANEWGRWVTPKLNAPELLWSQRHRLHNESVFISSATDPYQPIEKDFRLTRKCLQVLLTCPTTRVIIHTRSPLILQDLDLLKAFGDRLSVGFSIPTDDDDVRQIVEPDAPPIPARWATVEKLAKGGLQVGISAAPLLPVQDSQAFARRAKQSGATSAWTGGLRLLKEDPFQALLAEHDWLHILDPRYVESVRLAFQQFLPRRARSHRSLAPEPVWAHRPRFNPGLQPSLFTQAS